MGSDCESRKDEKGSSREVNQYAFAGGRAIENYEEPHSTNCDVREN
jgi:hypothetical protein